MNLNFTKRKQKIKGKIFKNKFFLDLLYFILMNKLKKKIIRQK